MISIDFNQILDFQFQESKKEYKRFFSWYFLLPILFSLKRMIKKENKELTNQLLNSKGIYTYLLENIADLKGTNLSPAITSTENIIKKVSAIAAYLEKKLLNPKLQELKTTHSLTLEILDVMYNILRLLKKNNLKTPIADISEEAKIAIGHSKNTLNKIFHGR